PVIAASRAIPFMSAPLISHRRKSRQEFSLSKEYAADSIQCTTERICPVRTARPGADPWEEVGDFTSWLGAEAA
ncbi:MAG: hypothetical protein M3308_07785, partial [Actinomycetota bacterium]|nr:hypothetical protein [Actinomycetota bacterium]